MFQLNGLSNLLDTVKMLNKNQSSEKNNNEGSR